MAENLRFISDMNVPTFVSTAGLLLDVPSAHFLGVIVDPRRWANDTPVLVRDRIKVVHAPTNPNLKGTIDIRPIARRLHDEGVIEYVEHGLRLVRAGGTVLIPRVLSHGAVADPVRRDAITTAYRSLIQEVQSSPAVIGALSTTGEGLLQLTTRPSEV